MYITMVCAECEKEVITPRVEYDPPEAVELHGTVCPDCDNGGFDQPVYYDRSGNEVEADPERF